jgi:alkylation response protein AidB-like acyl-CoA dehydrogenase
VHFAFSDQQTEFRDTVRQVLAKECTTDALRAAFEHPSAHTPRWDLLVELGVVALTVPEAHGGLGLGLVDLVLLLEEAGRVSLPEPLLETTGVVAPLLSYLARSAEPGVADRSTTWLEAIAEGRCTAAVGSVDTGAGGAGGSVAGADGADLVVLFTSGDDGLPELHVVDAEVMTVRSVPSLDPTRRLGVPHWSPTAESRVLSGPEATDAWRLTSDRAAAATAAELLGLADRMITVAADYAKERQQFGKPIGSFQAVKHLLAGAQVRLEFARPVVYAAAWSLDGSDPTRSPVTPVSPTAASRAASTAKAYASDAATEAARVSLQVHGAIGYTWECDLHLYLKRAWALAEAWGSSADHRALVLDSLVEESRAAG